MLYTYKEETQTVVVGNPIAFNQNEVKTGCTVTHNVGSPTIELNRPGFYMVEFNATVTGVAAGDALIRLTKNGMNVPGAVIGRALTVGVTNNVSMTAIVKVKPNCCQSCNIPASLQFVVNGVAAILTNVASTITKLA